MVPTTIVAVIITALLFVPGYVALVIWNRAGGWAPKTDVRLFASTVLISAICHAPFLWLVPQLLRWAHDGKYVEAGPVWTIFGWFIAVALVVPTILALGLSHWLDNPREPLAKWVEATFRTDRVSRAPTAWDVIWSVRAGWFIVVRMKSGEFIGGKFGTRSAVAFWKDGHDLFLEEEWTVDATGRFSETSERVPGSGGVWLNGETIESVRFASAEDVNDDA